MNNLKYLLTLQLFFLISPIFGQFDTTGATVSVNEFGDYFIFFQKKGTGSPMELDVNIGTARMGDKITLLEYPDLAQEDPMVKNLIEYINLILIYYNNDQITDGGLDKVLADKWEADKGRLKYRYTKYTPHTTVPSLTKKTNENGEDNEDIEKGFPSFIAVNSGNAGYPLLTPKDYRSPSSEIDGGGTGDTIGRNSILFITMAGDDKVYVAGGYHPLISEEYCVLLNRTSHGEYVLRTFSYKDWPEKGYDQPSPFYHWSRNGKTFTKELKSLKFEDFEVMTFLSGKPSLKSF